MSAKVSIVELPAAINFGLSAFQSDAFRLDTFQIGLTAPGFPVTAQVAITEIIPG